MVGKVVRRGKARTLSLAALAYAEEPDICAAGADFELHAFGTLGAVAHVGRALTIGINPGVHIAAGKVHAKKRLSPSQPG